MNASSFDQILRKVVIVPVLALTAGAGVLVWQIRAANQTVAQIERCDERIARTMYIEQLVIDQETGLRGYELTHDPRILQQYIDSKTALPAALEARRRLAHPERKVLIDALAASYETWEEAFATPLIATIQAGGETNDSTLNYHGKLLMDDIRAKIIALNRFTEAARAESVQRWHHQVNDTIGALMLAAVGLGLIIGLYVRNLVAEVSIAFRQSHNALRIRAEQTFRSEEKLRTTLRSIGDGVITCNAAGVVQSMNDMAQVLTGWSESDARDHSLEEVFRIVDAETRVPLESPLVRVARLTQVVNLAKNAILIRPDGSEIYVSDSGAPIRDKDSQFVGLVLVFRDITMAHKSQRALIANEKLAVAGRLAASIAHEIHNPLDSVSNLLFLMDGVATEDERTQFLELARQEIARVTQISRAMLSLYRESKIPVPIDVQEMLGSILLLMESQFNKVGVQVSADVPDGLAVRGFPAELRQVFTNLLTNAAEASGPNGRIQVTAMLCAPGIGKFNEDTVVVQIEDDGPGIPQDVLSNLFQPFYTTKGERGTGLGLWISKGIITKHGGQIDLLSSTGQHGHGTRVSVALAADSLPAA